MNGELLDIFVTEGRELLDRAGDDLSALRRDPADPVAFDGLYRAVHTLKGSAGLVDFAPMADLLHAAEDYLTEIRGRPLPEPLADGVARVLEQTARWIDAIARAGALPSGAGDQAQGLLRLFGALAAPTGGPSPPPAGATPDWALALVGNEPASPDGLVAVRYTPTREAYFMGEDPLATITALPGLVKLAAAPQVEFGELTAYDPFACNLVLSALTTASPEVVREALRLQGDQVEIAVIEARVAPLGAAPTQTGRTLRVDAGRVEALGTSLDELTVLKNSLAQLTGQALASLAPGQARAIADGQAALDRQLSRLHDDLMRLRLAPLTPLFRRFPRLVRDTAQTLGKEVSFTTAGGEVEIDKAVADGLFEPLLHLIRNALDHGVEPAAERLGVGKPAAARVRLSARAEADEVLIEVSDDGRGLEPASIRQAIVARGLLDKTAAQTLTDEAAIEQLFAPGFSTAAQVSELSGRGVGLDAVRHSVRALGGSVTLENRTGSGALATLRLPVRVRMARLITVEADGEIYAIPVDAVVETGRVPASAVNPVRSGHAMAWRDQALPLLPLAALLGRDAVMPSGDFRVLVVTANGEFAGLTVDGFGEAMEAPVRPLAGMLSRLPGLAGTTLLGDGRVLMVLNPGELIG